MIRRSPDGDLVVVRQQHAAENGEIVAAPLGQAGGSDVIDQLCGTPGVAQHGGTVRGTHGVDVSVWLAAEVARQRLPVLVRYLSLDPEHQRFAVVTMPGHDRAGIEPDELHRATGGGIFPDDLAAYSLAGFGPVDLAYVDGPGGRLAVCAVRGL